MKSRNDIYNALRVTILILIFAICTIFCVSEIKTTINAAEPAEGIGRVQFEITETPTTRNNLPEITHRHPEDPPFIRYELTDEERYHIEAVVAAESQGEDFNGQCLVAQCILNTIEATGKSPLEVIYEPKQFASPNYDEHELASEAVAAVFDDGTMVTGEPIQYFYAPKYCYSEWHENNLEFVMEHGGHRFFKEG